MLRDKDMSFSYSPPPTALQRSLADLAVSHDSVPCHYPTPNVERVG